MRMGNPKEVGMDEQLATGRIQRFVEKEFGIFRQQSGGRNVHSEQKLRGLMIEWFAGWVSGSDQAKSCVGQWLRQNEPLYTA